MRKLVSWLHRYLGLTLSVVLFVSACTGALITYNAEIDGVLNPALHKVEPRAHRASIDALAASGREAWPAHPIRFITFPEDAREAAEIWYRGSTMRAYVNPFSGQVLGVRDAHDSLMGILVDLHINWLAGDTGKRVIGWAGMATLFLLLLGLWLWWLRRNRWSEAFSIKWDAAAVRVWLDAHKLVGVTAGIFLIVIAATGSAMALHDSVTERVLMAVTGETATRPAPLSLHGPGAAASLDAMASQARALFPDGRLTRIVMPSNAQAAVAVRMRLPGEVHQLGRTFLYFDQYDGKLLRTDNIFEANAAARITSWLYPLHTGFYGGTATRLLNSVLGLSLALLALSGSWLWIRNSMARRRARTQRALRPERA